MIQEDIDEVRRMQDQLSKRLEAVASELDALHTPCEKCGARGGNAASLAGGYEAILCRPCRNAWSVAIAEAGHWLEYRLAVARVKVARDTVKAGVRAGHTPVSENEIFDAVTCHVEDLVLAERKLFQFALKWLAGGTP